MIDAVGTCPSGRSKQASHLPDEVYKTCKQWLANYLIHVRFQQVSAGLAWARPGPLTTGWAGREIMVRGKRQVVLSRRRKPGLVMSRRQVGCSGSKGWRKVRGTVGPYEARCLRETDMSRSDFQVNQSWDGLGSASLAFRKTRTNLAEYDHGFGALLLWLRIRVIKLMRRQVCLMRRWLQVLLIQGRCGQQWWLTF